MILYVNAAAERQGNGTKEQPFKHINDAAKIAMPGDTVLVAPGVYREYVNPVNAGTAENRITYKSEETLGAVITGSEVLTGWTLYQGTTWVNRVNNSVFGDYNPYIQLVEGDWYFAVDPRHTGSVYLNDMCLYETVSLEECLEGKVYAPSWDPENSIYKWYTEQDGNETVLYANFQGKNPNEECVEINVRRNCFFPDKTGVGYITLSGFTVKDAATTWAPPASFQDGMIGANWSKGWIIEDCEVYNSKCCGISLGNFADPENNQYFFHKHVKSPTQMERESVCRGQYHGWTKSKVGSHIVRRCNIHNCEQTGIVGRQGCVFSIIEDNHIHHINNMQQLGGAEIAGVKFHAAIDVIFRRNHIHHCTMGIWCDWQAQGTRITKNLMHDNLRPENAPNVVGGMMSQDIFVEVSHGPTLIDNNVLLSKASFRIASQGQAMVHNLILGALTAVGGGTGDRFTPYHYPHQTEVVGMMTFLHGDDRFYNNIWIQNWEPKESEELEDMGFRMKDNEIVGTGCWDEYPTYEEWISHFDFTKNPDMRALGPIHNKEHMPVWVNGNAYFNGATAYKNEKHNLINTTDKAYVKLVEENGDYRIETNVYDLLGDFTTNVIDSDVLGKAFEPEERFENPDGTCIHFDTDYMDSHRGLSCLPGPFASKADAEAVLFRPLAIEK